MSVRWYDINICDPINPNVELQLTSHNSNCMWRMIIAGITVWSLDKFSMVSHQLVSQAQTSSLAPALASISLSRPSNEAQTFGLLLHIAYDFLMVYFDGRKVLQYPVLMRTTSWIINSSSSFGLTCNFPNGAFRCFGAFSDPEIISHWTHGG